MQAPKGGTTGLNGEFYEGGQFLPESSQTVKGENKRSQKPAQARKQEIAPYKWVSSDKDSIWGSVSNVCKFHKTGYSKENGAEGHLELVGKWPAAARQQFQSLITRWNNGERWV